jgi:phage shock protein PspC (stress-responsive transcriptional regulator)
LTAFAARYGLVRPLHGRYLAGVCAAIGRATGTDPVLWRVLLAVLGFFGGIGIVVYLAAWLVIPAEGDTASPIEALLGRGQSSTSPVTVLVLGIVVAVILGIVLTDEFRALLLATAIVVGGLLLVNRNAAGRPPAGPPPPGPHPWPGATPSAAPHSGPAAPPSGPYPGPGTPPPAAPHPAPPATSPTTPPPDHPVPPAAPPPPTSPAEQPPHATTEPMTPRPPLWTPPPPTSKPSPAGGYRPPFAPHGPYAGARPPGPPPQRPPAARPPAPPRERSPLGAATISMIFIAVGVTVMLDLANVVDMTASTYFAVVLVTIALGLLVGTWFGRARWLIALGLLASLGLGTATLIESVELREQQRVWRPASFEQLKSHYRTDFGNSVLDLRKVDFTGRNAVVTVDVHFGNLTVIVPPDVDVTARAEVLAGSATLFNQRAGGFGATDEVTDLGDDGVGGGQLRLELKVEAGNLEVHR